MAQSKNFKSALFLVGIFIASGLLAADAMKIPPAPKQYFARFNESDFDTKPWMNEFRFVVVINKSEAGEYPQSIRVYDQGKLIQLVDVMRALDRYNAEDNQAIYNLKEQIFTSESWGSNLPKDFSVSKARKTVEELEKRIDDRGHRMQELSSLMWTSGVFKISTGRNAFEKKGEHHSQRDSWTVTPTGYYTAQKFALKHKSEAYSPKLCDSILGKIWGTITQKEMCTNIEWAVFFNDSIATHRAIPGTEPVLGNKASGGCVRAPGGLAEFIYNSAERNRAPIPVISKSGIPEVDAYGNQKYTESVESIWGRIDSRSILYIVTDSAN